ncbi:MULTISPECIES: dihydroorotase [unclassified Thioalkalivibrio]|uniref:dihydroorotase n=1 Tax=unclassified Thioalkalivibrio TaxID=2621013 RepID=UPI0003694922|nr:MULTISPECIES: dihydroorotase [unclassified Thioalkalivibrio]
MNRLTLTRPDDWHLHLRDGDVLASVLPDTARRFRRAIIMPNLKPPVTTLEAAAEYRDRILAALPEEADFDPLMTLYLTEGTTPGMIDAAKASGFVHGVKLYPAGATTNAASGVTDIRRCYPVFEAMQRVDLPLLIHGEVTDPDVDIFDREAVFIERHLEPLIRDFPELRVVLEHITTESAVQFIQDGPANVASTFTPQHLLYNRNALFAGGMRPHHFCLPILKRERHRKALVEAATSGHPRFFLGTDSAPHPRHAKESACGCAGIYSAHAAIELYAEAFAAADALDRLEGFASHFGPDFYKLPRNTDTLTLERSPWTVPEAVLFGHDPGVPLRAGETIAWQLAR